MQNSDANSKESVEQPAKQPTNPLCTCLVCGATGLPERLVLHDCTESSNTQYTEGSDQ